MQILQQKVFYGAVPVKGQRFYHAKKYIISFSYTC